MYMHEQCFMQKHKQDMRFYNVFGFPGQTRQLRPTSKLQPPCHGWIIGCGGCNGETGAMGITIQNKAL